MVDHNSLPYFVVLTVHFILSFHKPVLVEGQRNAECHFPRLTPRHGLNLTKFMGKWYLHEFAASDRGFDHVIPHFKCNRLNYVSEGDVGRQGRFVSVESHVNTTSGEVQHFRIPISAPKVSSPMSAIWDAVTVNGDTKMVVLNTDMEHRKWAILYSCNVHSRTRYRWETIGIWSRSEFLDAQMRETLKDYMIGLGFPMESHKFHSQEGC